MKIVGLIVIMVAVALGYLSGLGVGYAQTIGIEPVVTIKVTGTALITGLAGLIIQAAAPKNVMVECLLQQRVIEECNSPTVAQYAFTDEGDLIRSSDDIDGLGVFQFTGPSGDHDIVFTVLKADDDSGNPIIYSRIITGITIP